jgi:protein TonB
MRVGIFEEPEKWSGPMLVSTALHGVLAIIIVLVAWFGGPRGETWGGTSTGDAVNASLVSAVPLPSVQPPTENILANESKGRTETIPQTATPPPDAIPIPDRQTHKKPDRQAVTTATNIKPPAPPKDNVVPYGQGGPVSGPYGSFTASNTKGGFNFQDSGDFGSRFGWYVQQVNRTVSSRWYRNEVDPSVANVRRVYIMFDIMRDGTPANIRMEQSSGIPSLDQSAIRALQRIDTFGPLPDGYSGSKVSVEFWFDYQR